MTDLGLIEAPMTGEAIFCRGDSTCCLRLSPSYHYTKE